VLKRRYGALVLNSEGKVLMRPGSAEGLKNKTWDIPKGLVAEGESPREALIRGMVERNGIILKEIEFFDTKNEDDTENHIYSAKFDDEMNSRDTIESVDLRFLSEKEIDNIKIESGTMNLIKKILHG